MGWAWKNHLTKKPSRVCARISGQNTRSFEVLGGELGKFISKLGADMIYEVMRITA